MVARLTIDATPPFLRSSCGRTIPLDVGRWLADPEPEEHDLLDRAIGPVLDVGCGPARHVLALAARGIAALGVDNAPSAVALARRRGARVVHRSIFDRLPGAGRWGSALLLDGNIGIGGDPSALLARVRSLLHRKGRVLMELEPPGAPSSSLVVRTEDADGVSHWFDWAQLAADDVEDVAWEAGLVVAERWEAAGRWFARLDVAAPVSHRQAARSSSGLANGEGDAA